MKMFETVKETSMEKLEKYGFVYELTENEALDLMNAARMEKGIKASIDFSSRDNEWAVFDKEYFDSVYL
jgi:hypothetical protein